MVTLPLIPSQDQSLQLLQTRWKSVLDQALLSPLLNGNLITGVSLSVGNNIINHKLGRKLRGWILVDQYSTAGAIIYRSSSLSETTLTLNASAPVTVSLWVF